MSIDLLRQFPQLDWRWGKITRNENITWEDIERNPEFPWDYDAFIFNPNITIEIFESYEFRYWDKRYINWYMKDIDELMRSPYIDYWELSINKHLEERHVVENLDENWDFANMKKVPRCVFRKDPDSYGGDWEYYLLHKELGVDELDEERICEAPTDPDFDWKQVDPKDYDLDWNWREIVSHKTFPPEDIFFAPEESRYYIAFNCNLTLDFAISLDIRCADGERFLDLVYSHCKLTMEDVKKYDIPLEKVKSNPNVSWMELRNAGLMITDGLVRKDIPWWHIEKYPMSLFWNDNI